MHYKLINCPNCNSKLKISVNAETKKLPDKFVCTVCLKTGSFETKKLVKPLKIELILDKQIISQTELKEQRLIIGGNTAKASQNSYLAFNQSGFYTDLLELSFEDFWKVSNISNMPLKVGFELEQKRMFNISEQVTLSKRGTCYVVFYPLVIKLIL